MAQNVRTEKASEMCGVTVENVMDPRWLEAGGPLVHDGVRCVGCSSSPIVGRRLECDQCYDYNLCDDCCPSASRNLQRSLPTSNPHSTFNNNRPPVGRVIIPLLTLPSADIPQKQEHQADHSLSDVIDKDTNWSRALRLKQGGVFRTIIGDSEHSKYMALKWVMNKEKSTQGIASYLLDLKGTNDQGQFISNSVINMTDNALLIKALRNCWGDVALNLIDRGVKIDVNDAEDGKKMTPLMWACKTNQPRVVEKLLERTTEENINRTNEENMSALAIAVANKNDECIQHILHCAVPVQLYSQDSEKEKLLPFSYEILIDFLDNQINQIKPTWSSISVVSSSDENQQDLTEDENMIEFNYNNIISENSELSVINDIVHLRKENICLLKHPLLQAMVMMKWMKFQWLWLLELVLQFVFTILMFNIGTSVLKIEPNNCWNKTIVQIRKAEEDVVSFRQETATLTILASILWIFYVLVEIVQFSFSVIETLQNLTAWKGVFVEMETKEPENETKNKENEPKEPTRGRKRAKISKIIRNFYFPIPTYLKELENWLQLLIITIRYY